MISKESLLDRTETYLKTLFASIVPALEHDFEVTTPFGELGVDSFRVLKLIKALEADFGTLPKTLLFECFNVEALARYFVERHEAVLQEKFSGTSSGMEPAAPWTGQPAPAVMRSAASPASATVRAMPRRLEAVLTPAPARISAEPPEPLRLLERDLPEHAELQAVVESLAAEYSNEGGVSRGTRDIAPNLFIGSTRRGYFNYSRCGDMLLVYAYTGPEDEFAALAAEMLRYCMERGYVLNMFIDRELDAIDGTPFSSTPFGALQRVSNLRGFKLSGGAMRRLRYQVSRFEKAGAVRTLEYRCGSDPDVDRSIAALIDRWCETKPMVNPLIQSVRAEVLAGSLPARHRVFLTYLDDRLQNVILISRLCDTLNGYLMDLEFYGADMAQGGLEYAIVHIIRTLATEGCDMLSLGGTYGCRLGKSANADPEVDAVLDDLHSQGIFNDESNLQFKNKFRPENRIIYLCRPADCGCADRVIDLIMMIADPLASQTSDDENHNVGLPPTSGESGSASTSAGNQPHDEENLSGIGSERARALQACGYNPLGLAADAVEVDFKTDSWAQLATPYVAAHMRALRAHLQQPMVLAEALQSVFPFPYALLTDAGRTAEKVLCKAWASRGEVPQNLLFPTGIYHQIDQGFAPCEFPPSEVFALDGDDPLKGGLDEAALRARLAQDAGSVAFVCVELGNNAAGGYPVTLAQLGRVKAMLGGFGVPLVVDATRVLDNARMLIEHETGQADREVFDVARELLAMADVVVGSLAKNFCVDAGGILATRDEALFRRFQDTLREEGGALDVIGRKLVAVSLARERALQTCVQRRGLAVQAAWRVLAAHQMPIVHPVGGHCVLIDVKRLPAFAALAHPVPSFLAWLYMATGIRAGAHSVGMQQGTALNGLVRLAIPVGLEPEEAADAAERLVQALAHPHDIPDLAPVGDTQNMAGGDIARYELRRIISPSSHTGVAEPASDREVGLEADAAPVAVPPPAASAASRTPVRQACGAAAPPSAKSPGALDIAVVGMSGRYPKAADLTAFWDNLSVGRDCIGPLPEARQAWRTGPLAQRYRGGFIDDVECFDSLFFNISPREAEALDPQERLFLEVAWEAVEDAGYYPEILGGAGGARDVGVFVGAVWAMYQIVGVEEKLAGNMVHPNSFLWSIANRVSYWMNLTGPSLTVDTACSSSLTAIHLACEAIRRGDCSSAIVGGVNLDLHQHKFDINHAGGALSADGLCRSFGAGANGYVAGEGAGALFIKPLAQAIADRDQILGVIRAVAANHGGRTSGYTVPNPRAQGDLIATALRRAGIDARSIGYIEAHGTGTELGDPIEIAGLARAFEPFGVTPQSCPIGSVKSNIGHLEAAAGVVGVAKVLLQMRYGVLVPSLHASELNPHIDFAQSPFYVQRELQAWTQREIDGRVEPLRAGISSFGAGGANAHVIVEQYVPVARPLPEGGTTYVFPLSARTEAQLRDMAERLRAHLARPGTPPRLDDVAFTLQHGRKSFEHRLAIVASSIAQLIARLKAFLAGEPDPDVLTGQASQADGITGMLSGQEREQFVALLAQSRDPHGLARLWLNGLLADCRGLPHGDGCRTSLPLYPFAKKRHWIGTAAELRGATTAALHPLIDSNESTFERQLFRKRFHAHEFFMNEHMVSGAPTLPGTAYLDLARKAGELAGGRPVRAIRNVTWVSPLSLSSGASVDAVIELRPAGDSAQFEVYGTGPDGAQRLHAQGRVVFGAEEQSDSAPEFLDLDAIRARSGMVIEGPEAYALFEQVGLRYGPSFQLLRDVRKNDDEVLGRLSLTESRAADFDSFVLHPCILDAAMQAGVAAQLRAEGGEAKVPYAIGEVEILHPLTTDCFSYITRAESSAGASTLTREHVTICDAQGRVLVRMRDSVGVPVSGVDAADKSASPPALPQSSDDEGFARLFYRQQWEPAPPPDGEEEEQTLVLFDVDETLRDACCARHCDVVLVLPGEGYARRDAQTYVIDPTQRDDYVRLFQVLGENPGGLARIAYAWPRSQAELNAETLPALLERSLNGFFLLCQALLEVRRLWQGVRLIYLHAAPSSAPQPQHEAMIGFVRSLRLETPRMEAKVLEVCHAGQARPPVEELAGHLLTEFRGDRRDHSAVRYEDGRRFGWTLKTFAPPAVPSGLPLRERGVYLITGGAGGLGLVFAEYLARQCHARLVLSGRSPLSPRVEKAIERLQQLGAEAHYVAADVARADDARRLVDETMAHFGALHGILHAAGTLRDSVLSKKTAQDLADVCAPKIYGCHHLDEATLELPLDVFVLFSSLAAFGNIGQCDYAYANHYLDVFAERRERQRAAGERYGRTLSLNWSLWAEGGMTLDEATEAFFRKRLGIRPLARELGLEAFALALSTAPAQLAVLDAVKEKIEAAWGLSTESPPQAASGYPARADEGVASAVTRELSQIVMSLLKLGADELSLDAVLTDLGFDSMGLMSLANAINTTYGLDLNPTAFFEHPSIRALVQALITQHAAAVAQRHGNGPTAAAPAARPILEGGGAEGLRPIDKRRLMAEPAFSGNSAARSEEGFAPERRFHDMPIAIVGIAGVMPQSENLEAFWDGLRNARNLVTEVPRDRWVWEDYDGNPIKQANKSNSRWGGFMLEVDKFDPLFFGITPREAEMMDPQQRIFLETVWSAIEDSGHKVSDLAGTRTGLFVGVSARDYVDVLVDNAAVLDGFSASGNSHSIMANRVSFLLNLRGPSAPIDTACSSSLIALHRAIESIHLGESEMAIVGGAQVMLTPVGHISLSSAGMLSVDGRCKTFDQNANGYVRGEGVGAMLIKPLAQAERDGNPIYAVVRASAENHGGRVTMLTAPNPKAQAELLLDAYGKAGIDPATVGYIECHGTGTSLGDPIEIQALKSAFAELYRQHGKKAPAAPHCGLGSVKTNIGHLEPAAGIASLIKVLLSIKHREIPALLHFETLNPYIDLAGSPFYIVEKTCAWPAPTNDDGALLPRRAGVSSFGWGGANAHVVLEEYPARASVTTSPGPQMVVLSARNRARLDEYARLLHDHLRRHPADLAEVAYTLQVGRDAMEERLAVLAESVDQLLERLDGYLSSGQAVAGVWRGQARPYRRNDNGLSALEGDAGMFAPAADLLARGEYGQVLEAWVNGAGVDWAALHGLASPRRVSLPTYPFARERHWITRRPRGNDLSQTGGTLSAGFGDPDAGFAASAQLDQLRTRLLADLRDLDAMVD